MPTAEDIKETRLGIYYAVASFLMWGLVPVYFKFLEHVSAFEVIAHRILWSCLFLGAVILVMRSYKQTWHYLHQRQLMLSLLLSAIVVSINWLVFVWAVSQGNIVETSLGYFINPLLNIVFGMLFFAERLRRMQWAAIALAAVGVLYQIILLGDVPWVALALAFSFATYGALRKRIKIDATDGLFIETLWLSPLAIVYMIWLDQSGTLQFFTEDSATVWLLVCTGLVTSFPLLSFAAGASRISLSLIGMLQYIGPSIAFTIAVFYYNEPMNMERLTTFVLIWIALILYTLEGLYFHKTLKPQTT